ncbi:Uncharacterized membrane protein [Pilibacter termitis]|uniref:Uncharacterized membrane protein n=1 Tax=Pilibacter termitis TaxID=263852 RepID=A0A1T4L1G8_9ENTE|nr:ECF transporter S component [Pilibacter termitis]SJZ48555.1 Uncharacterized membrane protein [Pilibacter termitis]
MKTKTIVQVGIFTGLTVVLGFVVKIPTGNGLVTLADMSIFALSMLLGKKRGFAIGALSGFLIDVLSGYYQWCLISLLVHGVQGYLAGSFKGKYQPVGVALGAIFMLVGYFVAETLMFNIASGFAALSGNVMQEVVGILGAIPIVLAFKKMNLFQTKGI